MEERHTLLYFNKRIRGEGEISLSCSDGALESTRAWALEVTFRRGESIFGDTSVSLHRNAIIYALVTLSARCTPDWFPDPPTRGELEPPGVWEHGMQEKNQKGLYSTPSGLMQIEVGMCSAGH